MWSEMLWRSRVVWWWSKVDHGEELVVMVVRWLLREVAEVEGSSPSFHSWLRCLVVMSRVGIASRSNPSFPGLPTTLLIQKKPPAIE